ncbi:MAG TPA: hypothetical protein VFA15_08070, partial [Nitrososphaera sp.]|nr:hypothetical protein [Nitrososphaera sp.]
DDEQPRDGKHLRLVLGSPLTERSSQRTDHRGGCGEEHSIPVLNGLEPKADGEVGFADSRRP